MEELYDGEIHTKTTPVLITSKDKSLAIEAIGHMIRKPGSGSARRKWREFTGKVYKLVGEIPITDTDTSADIEAKLKNGKNKVVYSTDSFIPYEYELALDVDIEMPTEEGTK